MEKNNMMGLFKKDRTFKGGLPTVLVTGFGPFRNFTENSSWLTVKELLNLNITDYQIIAKELPVRYDVISDIVPKLWEQHKPKLVVHCGMSADVKCLYLEKIAHNMDYVSCDIEGSMPENNVCCIEGKEVLSTAIDIDKVVQEVASADVCVKAQASENAGRYLCEFIFYTSLAISKNTAFVHVPPVNEPYSARAMAHTLSLIITSMLDQLD